MSLAELKEKTSNLLDWTKLLNTIARGPENGGDSDKVWFTDQTLVYAPFVEYLQMVARLFSETDARIIRNYLGFK